MNGLLALLVIALAAHYTTYCVTESALFAGVRSLLAKRVPTLGQLAGCYNCMAFWSALLMWALSVWSGWTSWFVTVLAVATCVQFLMQLRWRTEP